MAIALAGIASVMVIVVALILSAAYIVTHEKKEWRPKRRATQEEIDQFFESLEKKNGDK